MLGALAGLSFSVDRSAYAVGDKPVYRITGAAPGGKIAWTSYRDGQATGEYQASYGQYVDEAGNATLQAGQPWDASHLGQWQKHVIIIPPEWPSGSLENAQVSFSVGEVAANSPTPTPTPRPDGRPVEPSPVDDGISDFFSGTINLPVVGKVPTVAVVAGGALLFFALSSGSSGGRR